MFLIKQRIKADIELHMDESYPEFCPDDRMHVVFVQKAY